MNVNNFPPVVLKDKDKQSIKTNKYKGVSKVSYESIGAFYIFIDMQTLAQPLHKESRRKAHKAKAVSGEGCWWSNKVNL